MTDLLPFFLSSFFSPFFFSSRPSSRVGTSDQERRIATSALNENSIPVLDFLFPFLSFFPFFFLVFPSSRSMELPDVSVSLVTVTASC